jgi:hypothetical protein
VLGRVRPLYEQRPARVAALWFEEMGSSAPHSLWVAPVDSIAYATPELHRTTVISFSHDNGSGLRVLARDGEVLVETLADQWPGSSGVDTWLCNACPHLSQRSTWRLTATGALLLRVQPVDDAAFAVARAFDARHGYRAWPDHDVVVAADVDGWMRARTWAVLMDVMPRGDGGARVAIFSRGRGDSLGLEVRRPQGAAGAWRIDAAR